MMDTTGNSVYTKDFDNQEVDNKDNNFNLGASSTFTIIAYKFKINITCTMLKL